MGGNKEKGSQELIEILVVPQSDLKSLKIRILPPRGLKGW